MFAAPRTHPVLVRLAQGPGELLSDSVSTHRGMAIKVFGAEGPKLPGHEGADTQDFVLATGPAFPQADASAFRVADAASKAAEVVAASVPMGAEADAALTASRLALAVTTAAAATAQETALAAALVARAAAAAAVRAAVAAAAAATSIEQEVSNAAFAVDGIAPVA